MQRRSKYPYTTPGDAESGRQRRRSVLALTGQGSETVADGVGVQLLYNNAPVQLNNRLMLKQSSDGTESLPITARYYQTKPVVKAGEANATATLDMTYQ